MAESIEIEKTITVNVDGEDVNINKNIDVQVDFIECGCGENLEFELSSDHMGDIQISVEEHSCIQGPE